MCLVRVEYCNESLTDICIHGPCCVIFVLLGVIQITSGIYYYLSIPLFKLIFNVFIGCSSVLLGVCGITVVCICLSNLKKYEILLYCSTGVIFLNTVNLILLEFGQIKDIFSDQFRLKIKDTSFDFLPTDHGRLITSITAIVSVLVAFVESQITFCCLNQVHYLFYERKVVKSNNAEQTADLEYVIDKRKLVNIPSESSGSVTLPRNLKPGLPPKPTQNHENNTKIEVYAQSWVFKENIQGGTPGSSDSLDMSSPELTPKVNLRTHQRKVSEISQTPSAMQMVSFSRSVTPVPSPVPHDQDRMFNTIARGQHHSRSNSDYLSVASTPKHYENTMTLRSPHRLTQPLQSSNTHHDPEAIHKLRSTFANTAQAGPSYATLISELEQSLSGKLHQTSFSSNGNNVKASISNDSVATLTDDKACSSKSSKEGEFSKELELALQLIQELETPSEINPMNPKLFSLDGHSTNLELHRAGSDKTLSALSLGDFTSPTDQKEFTTATPDTDTII